MAGSPNGLIVHGNVCQGRAVLHATWAAEQGGQETVSCAIMVWKGVRSCASSRSNIFFLPTDFGTYVHKAACMRARS